MGFKLRCYAYGSGDSWQAICTDLDIAVEGGSFQEARESLESCIKMYLERVSELPEAERRELLGRKSPWHLRGRLAWKAWLSSIRNHPAYQEFIVPSHLPALS